MTKYIQKALSKDNRKIYDGDSNARYRIVISMAEVGGMSEDEEGGFWFELKIPQQVDNELGRSIINTINNKKEAIKILKEVIDELSRNN